MENIDNYVKLLNAHAEKAQDPVARENIKMFADLIPFIREDDYAPVSVYEAMQEQKVLRPLKITGSICNITNPVPIDCRTQEGEQKRLTACQLGIRDTHDAVIEVLHVGFDVIRPYLLNSKRREALLVFKGTVVSFQEDKHNWGYFFILTEICPLVSQADLLNMSKQNCDLVKAKLKELVLHPGGFKEFVRNELIEMFNIRGLEKAPELNAALDFMILQAFSFGMSSQGVYSNKLHSLVVGAPASGKKLLTRIALALSPNGRQVSSTSSKVTPAGLIGRVRIDGNSSRSDPGIIPLSNHGIVCFEDFHEITKKRNEVSSILASVMEDGKVEDSTSARTTHLACTSVHIDMNRLSQVELSGECNLLSDLNIPYNVISRFDFILEIPADAYRQMEVALDMMGRFGELSSNESVSAQEERAFRLKALVAYVNSAYSRVHLPEESVIYMKEKFRELFESGGAASEISGAMGGIMTRLQISLEKLAKAVCTLDLKQSISKEHIDKAFEIVSYKLRFLSSLDLCRYISSGPKANSRPSGADRKKMLLEHFKGQAVPLRNALEYVNSVQDFQFDERTLRRDLDSLIQAGRVRKQSQGLWEFE